MIRTHRETPPLRLALLGFDAADAARIQSAWRRAGSVVEWVQSALAQADALFINGMRTLMLGDDTVVVDTSAGPVRLDLAGLRRPVAISPAALSRPSQALPFDATLAGSIQVTLSLFERKLREEALQFCVASCLVERQPDLSANAFHLCEGDRLLAVVSRRNGVGVLRGITPDQVYRASWLRRPLAADEIPARMAARPLAEVLWRFGRRSRRNLLPPRLLRARLECPQAPAVAPWLLDDADLAVLRAFSAGPATLHELASASGLAPAIARRSVACLHLVGCVQAAAAPATLFGFPWRRVDAGGSAFPASEFPLTAQLFGPPAAAPARMAFG